MRMAPPPDVLSGLASAHGPLRRMFTRARRLGLELTLLRLEFSAARQDGRGGSGRVALFLPRLSTELRATDLAWRGRRQTEWMILLEAAPNASAAIQRWQESAREWGLELRVQQIRFPGGGLTLAALLAALQPGENGSAAAPGAVPAAGGDANGG